MSCQDRFAELWTDYLEGELDDSGVLELRELLMSDEGLLKRAADLFQTHRLLGLVTEEKHSRQEKFIHETLAMLPENQDAFVSSVMSSVQRTSSSPRNKRKAHHSNSKRIWGVVALVLVAVLLFSFRPQKPIQVAGDGNRPEADSKAQGNARLASIAHAKFFGELSPPVGSVLALEREYVLMSGMVQVVFPAGASAILEGPAVFRVTSNESLALDVGRCSVHAPDGAEGFRIDTPLTRVVDRGTRFSVSVAESSETEVQVIEGAADIYDAGRNADPSRERDAEVRLINGEARKFATNGTFATDPVAFDSRVYRHGLPDRVVSYQTSQAADGGSENLISVTVQRGGQRVETPVEDLIPARVTWFKSTSRRAYLCGGATLPSQRRDSTSDRSLVTGVINPDGSHEPLAESPVMDGESGTPGLAIRFDRPVVNGPGADVVFFDLQTFANPPDGDAFHVSPLSFRDGLKSHTIHKYDLTMESPEAHDLTNFHVHFFAKAAGSLAQLETNDCSSQKQVIRFRGLAVGIDLSDLGYSTGEAVEGLFFQDALDDEHHVDPVFIGGLPEIVDGLRSGFDGRSTR